MWHTVFVSEPIEKRVQELERKVAELSGLASSRSAGKNPWQTFGAFKDDPDFEQALKSGQKYRKQQTYDNEIAGS